MSSIYHIVSQEDYEKAAVDGAYSPASLEEEGFIHCSYAEQVCEVAERFYRGTTGLILLEIDPAQTGCDVVDEDLYQHGALFPHIYGALPNRAVLATHRFAQDPNGVFHLPGSISSWL